MQSESVIESIGNSFKDMIDQIVSFGPKLLGALVVLFVGIIVARIFARIVGQVVRWLEKQEVVKDFEETIGLKKGVSNLFGKFAYWVVFIVFLSAAADVLQLSALSETVDDLVAFTPKLFSAIVIAGVTYLGSKVLRDLAESALSHADKALVRPVGLSVQTIVMVFGIITALAQLGLNLGLLEDNITVVMAGVALAFGLSVGLGGRKLATSYMTGLLNADAISKGQKVHVDDVKGTIKSVGKLSAVVETSEGDVVVSLGRLVR